MKMLLFSTTLALGLIFIPACKNNQPISPNSSPSIFFLGDVERLTYCNNNACPLSINSSSVLNLQVNGKPVSTAIVFLTGTNLSLPVTLPYTGPEIDGAVTYAVYLLPNGEWPYQVGASYTLTCVSMGVTTSSTLTAPGNITAMSDLTGAVTFASWAAEGNDDTASVETDNFAVTTFSAGPDLTSPVVIDPVTPYPAPGQYDDFIRIRNRTIVPNTVSGSYFILGDSYQKNLTK